MITTPVKQWRRQKDVASILGTTGTLMSWTIIRVAAKSLSREAPYPVGIIKLDHGKQMIAQLVDFDEKDLAQGQKVVAVLRKTPPENTDSSLSYIVKFRPYTT